MSYPLTTWPLAPTRTSLPAFSLRLTSRGLLLRQRGVLLSYPKSSRCYARGRWSRYVEPIPRIDQLMLRGIQNALAICREWPSGVHLEVEDVYHIPLFEVSLKLVSTDYDSPSHDHIARLLEYVTCITFPLFPALMGRHKKSTCPWFIGCYPHHSLPRCHHMLAAANICTRPFRPIQSASNLRARTGCKLDL